MIVALPKGKRWLSTAEAAQALGVTMGRVRQLAEQDVEKGGLTKHKAAGTALMFDEEEVKKLAKAKRKTGRPRGGFKAN